MFYLKSSIHCKISNKQISNEWYLFILCLLTNYYCGKWQCCSYVLWTSFLNDHGATGSNAFHGQSVQASFLWIYGCFYNVCHRDCDGGSRVRVDNNHTAVEAQHQLHTHSQYYAVYLASRCFPSPQGPCENCSTPFITESASWIPC